MSWEVVYIRPLVENLSGHNGAMSVDGVYVLTQCLLELIHCFCSTTELRHVLLCTRRT
jgi:hypothetical protein